MYGKSSILAAAQVGQYKINNVGPENSNSRDTWQLSLGILLITLPSLVSGVQRCSLIKCSLSKCSLSKM